jgi:MOSC domain-containing protein YiiM
MGRGAQEALRRRGGSICRVLSGGTVLVGDEVQLGADDERDYQRSDSRTIA